MPALAVVFEVPAITMARDVNDPGRRRCTHHRRRRDESRIGRRNHHGRRTRARDNNPRARDNNPRGRDHYTRRRGMTDDNMRQGRKWQTDANINATGM